MLRLYNTMTRHVDDFMPASPPDVGLYTCGPTVYNYAHIGNLRTYVFEDILKRSLRLCGFQVKHVMNVTDVGHLVSDSDEGEDKMIVAMRREGRDAYAIAAFYWDAFRKDLSRLAILEPDIWCKATDHIAEQKAQVEAIAAKGYTYVIDDGIYFDTSKLGDYGKLARLDIAGLEAGHRVEMVAGKKNPTDFALWKFSPKDQQRQMEWDNPCGIAGKGFPGWHIECSAMAIKYLGERLDIHCGGVDHVAVHHTNEIAQAEATLGHPWCNWWMHAEFLTVPKDAGGGRMSKSSGEFLTLQLLIDRGYDPLAYRYFCLNAHYRQQLAFTWTALDAAASAFSRLKRLAIELRGKFHATQSPLPKPMAEFREAVEDDLNMPRALAAMWNATKDEHAEPGEIYATLRAMDAVLGFGFDSMQEEALAVSDAQVQRLLDDRAAARKAKDFARADAIRKELDEMGVEIMDSPKGTTWRKK